MLFMNDMAILHGREQFSDGGVKMKRHLLKFYLRDPKQNWPVPPQLEDAWSKIYGPNEENGEREMLWCPRWEEGAENDWRMNG